MVHSIIQILTYLTFMKTKHTFYFILPLLIIIFSSSCKTEKTQPLSPIYEFTKTMVDDSAMVVTAHPVASKAGYDILRKGGNAIDAAIAVQFSLAVCYPIAGNIGGGGFLVYRDKDGNIDALDYREMAPSASTHDMYLDENGNAVAEKSQNGALAVGVPGTTAGMYEAYLKYSKLKDWEALLAPAIESAEKGFRLTFRQAGLLNKNKAKFDKYNSDPIVFNSKEWKGGDLLIQPELAATLKAIAKDGPKGFYWDE